MSQLCLLLLHISEVHDSFTYLKDICQNIFSHYFTARLYSTVLHTVIVRFHLRLFCIPSSIFPQTFLNSWRNRHGIVLRSYIFEEHHTLQKKKKHTKSSNLFVFGAQLLSPTCWLLVLLFRRRKSFPCYASQKESKKQVLWKGK